MNDNEKYDTASDNTFEAPKRKRERHTDNYFDLIDLKLSDFKPEIQPWLWKNVIPKETLTLFAGYGAQGKSQLLMFLAGAVSTGLSFQAGGETHQFEQGKVLLIDGENNIKNDLVPRAMAIGANLDNFLFLRGVGEKGQSRKKRMIKIADDLSRIEDMIAKDGNYKLIIIDPMQSFLGDIRENHSGDVVNLISRCIDLATDQKLAFIINKHLRKGNGESFSSITDEVAGSSSWITAPRQAFLINKDKKAGHTIFTTIKSNISPDSDQAFAFKIKPFTVTDDDGQKFYTSRIEWEQEMITVDKDDLINKKPDVSVRNLVIRCIEKTPKQGATFKLIKTYVMECGYGGSYVYDVVDKLEKEGIIEEREGMTKKGNYYEIAKKSTK